MYFFPVPARNSPLFKSIRQLLGKTIFDRARSHQEIARGGMSTTVATSVRDGAIADAPLLVPITEQIKFPRLQPV